MAPGLRRDLHPHPGHPDERVPYLDYLAPGIIAQSTMFIAIFYGIQIIGERDSGVLTKLLVTPTPGRSAR
ncbi:ABC transporter permease [Nonomuraea pusilla]|uniref:ABC transporter permease n=1 Tax=Nonomuraea pusilla TaxID=46177 RepID=UPI00332E9679